MYVNTEQLIKKSIIECIPIFYYYFIDLLILTQKQGRIIG